MIRRSIYRFCAYQKEFNLSVKDPRTFWSKQINRVAWFKRPEIILDDSNPPFFRWFKDGELNLAHLCLDRHLDTLGDSVALHYISPMANIDKSYTYKQLHEAVSKFAGGLQNELGIKAGDRVIIYMPMVPEALVAMLACARIGAIHSVVFGGFAAQELANRIVDAQPKAIITSSFGLEGQKELIYKPIIDEALQIAQVKGLKTIVYEREGSRVDCDYDFYELMNKSSPSEALSLPANHPAYILYTSGTTGSPKGILRDIGGTAISLDYTLDKILDIGPKDVLFSTSDIGWVVGHCFNVYGPLMRGGTAIFYEGKPVGTPDAGIFWRIVQEKKVKHLFTAPTAIRIIRKEDQEGRYLKYYDISSLKALSIAGERCDIPTYKWLSENLPGRFINDNYWQTESGWPIVSNFQNLTQFTMKPGSATKPVPGYNVQILDEQGQECAINQLGKICFSYPTPPGFALTIWGKDEAFIEKYFSEYEGYYNSSDAGYKDQEGYIHVMTRLDDIINTAGHRICTASIEEVIMHNPKIGEAIVIGVKDEIKGEIPVGFVTLKDSIVIENEQQAQELEKEIVALVRHEIGPVACFKHCIIVPKLPKTRSGKYLRHIIRAMANKLSYKVPPTIEDHTILEFLEKTINSLTFLKQDIVFEEDLKQ